MISELWAYYGEPQKILDCHRVVFGSFENGGGVVAGSPASLPCLCESRSRIIFIQESSIYGLLNETNCRFVKPPQGTQSFILSFTVPQLLEINNKFFGTIIFDPRLTNYGKSEKTIFSENFNGNGWTDSYEILYVYQIGLRIGQHLFFIPLNDLPLPYP